MTTQMKINKLRTDITIWALLKLIELCKGDMYRVARVIEPLKEQAIKDGFKPFKIAMERGNKGMGYPDLKVEVIDVTYIDNA